jgi:hypothetical protein
MTKPRYLFILAFSSLYLLHYSCLSISQQVPIGQQNCISFNLGEDSSHCASYTFFFFRHETICLGQRQIEGKERREE